MAIFNCYVSSPEGKHPLDSVTDQRQFNACATCRSGLSSAHLDEDFLDLGHRRCFFSQGGSFTALNVRFNGNIIYIHIYIYNMYVKYNIYIYIYMYIYICIYIYMRKYWLPCLIARVYTPCIKKADAWHVNTKWLLPFSPCRRLPMALLKQFPLKVETKNW